jgi:TDG/mug DNA glycosylase family protein
MTVLPDILQPGLRLILCGTAAGSVSAAKRAYYAGPGNKFWRVLYEVGLTPYQIRPSDYPVLLSFGIGLTDLAKHFSGADTDLPKGCFDAAMLRQKVETILPRALAFNGKLAARVFFDRRTGPLEFGRQPEMIGTTAIYVLPSTSGAASGDWSIEPWRILAREESELFAQLAKKPVPGPTKKQGATAMTNELTAEEFAKAESINAKTFRARLRETFLKHSHYERWKIRTDSPEYAQWKAIASEIKRNSN